MNTCLGSRSKSRGLRLDFYLWKSLFVLFWSRSMNRRKQIGQDATPFATFNQELNLLPLGHAGGKVIIHVPEIVETQRREFFIAEGLGQELANVGSTGLAVTRIASFASMCHYLMCVIHPSSSSAQ